MPVLRRSQRLKTASTPAVVEEKQSPPRRTSKARKSNSSVTTPTKSNKLAVGERIYAKWPGTSSWYEGSVVDNLDFDDFHTYDIIVDTDETKTVLTLRSTDVKPSTFFNRGRSRSRSRSRSRARSSTPSRNSKSKRQSSNESPAKSSSPRRQSAVRKPPTPARRSQRSADQNRTAAEPAEQSPRRSSRLQHANSDTPDAGGQRHSTVDSMVVHVGKCVGGLMAICGLLVFLILVIFALYALCSKSNCPSPITGNLSETAERGQLVVESLVKTAQAVDGWVVASYAGWFLLLVVLYLVPIGRTISVGSKRKLRLNGLISLAVVSVVYVVGSDRRVGLFELDRVVAHWSHFAVVSAVASVVLSVYFYVRHLVLPGRFIDKADAAGSNWALDLFLGYEANPTCVLTGRFDWKHFLEIHFGLISWALAVTVHLHSALADSAGVYQAVAANPALVFMSAAQLWYICDALLFEAGNLTMFDFTQERLGLMLTFGNMMFVPFGFSIPIRFLWLRGSSIKPSSYLLIGAGALHLCGYIIFRVANSQKDEFKLRPRQRGLRTVVSEYRGRPLLADGLWRICRHPNYLGDLIMAYSWALPAGAESPWAWFYAVYLSVLLVSRLFRVEAHCQLRYGRTWHEYTALVRSRLVPFIF